MEKNKKNNDGVITQQEVALYTVYNNPLFV